VVFQIFYLALALSLFQTRRTEMPVVELDIAQRAQKPTAYGAGNDRLFARVIEATRFFFSLQRVSGLPGWQFAEKSRVDIHAHRFFTCRTGSQHKGVDNPGVEWRFALAASKHKQIPL